MNCVVCHCHAQLYFPGCPNDHLICILCVHKMLTLHLHQEAKTLVDPTSGNVAVLVWKQNCNKTSACPACQQGDFQPHMLLDAGYFARDNRWPELNQDECSPRSRTCHACKKEFGGTGPSFVKHVFSCSKRTFACPLCSDAVVFPRSEQMDKDRKQAALHLALQTHLDSECERTWRCDDCKLDVPTHKFQGHTRQHAWKRLSLRLFRALEEEAPPTTTWNGLVRGVEGVIHRRTRRRDVSIEPLR